MACVKLDRLARSVRHLTEMSEEFEALGIVVADGVVDLDDAHPAAEIRRAFAQPPS